MAAATVYVIDDDEDVLKSLTWLIESLQVRVCACDSAAEFLSRYVPDLPACLVLDVKMPQMSGLELQALLNRLPHTPPVIFMSGHADIPMAVKAMRDGALDFLQKPFSDDELLNRVQEALRLDALRLDQDVQRLHINSRLEQLTPREHEILLQVITGLTSREIGEQLNISPKTVETHRARLMDKLQVNSLAELMRLLAYAGPGLDLLPRQAG